MIRVDTGHMSIHQTILVLSERLELGYYFVDQLKSKFRVERCGYTEWEKTKEKNLALLRNSSEVFIIDGGDFQESINLVKEARLCAYVGAILLISKTEKRCDQIEEKIYAINSGVDEYLGYPQTSEEIAASVKALLRHYGRKEELEFQIGGEHFLVNSQTRKVLMDQKKLQNVYGIGYIIEGIQ